MLVSRMTPCIVDGMLWPVLESTIFNETELAPMLFVATDVVINKVAMKPNIKIKIYGTINVQFDKLQQKKLMKILPSCLKFLASANQEQHNEMNISKKYTIRQ
jgi:hypothetical protein